MILFPLLIPVETFIQANLPTDHKVDQNGDKVLVFPRMYLGKNVSWSSNLNKLGS